MSKTFKVLSIDAWADHQDCPHCGSNKFTDTTKGTKLKCSCCLEEFNDNEGISWSWNNWFTVGEYNEEIEGELNEENAMKYFQREYVIKGHEDKFEIEDDQYNLILIEKENRQPLYAVEYGNNL